MNITNAIKRMVPYRLVLMRRELLPLIAKWTRKNMKRKDFIPILHFHLVDHCNLNCPDATISRRSRRRHIPRLRCSRPTADALLSSWAHATE